MSRLSPWFPRLPEWARLKAARARAAAWPLAVLAVGLVLSSAIFRQAEDMAERERGLLFERRAEQVQHLFENYFLINELALRGLQGQFYGSEYVNRAEFHRYYETLTNLKGYPALRGIGYIRALRHEELPAFVEAVRADKSLRAEGQPDYRVFPASPGPEHFVSEYAEPALAWTRLGGYDLASEPRRRAALEAARDSGGFTVRDFFLRAKPGEERPAMLMVLALYRGGQLPAALAERRARLYGWVVSGIGIEDVVADAFARDGALLQELGVELVEPGPAGAERRLYGNTAPSAEPAGLQRGYALGMGTPWLLRVSAPASFGSWAQHWGAYLAAALAMSLSLSASLVAYHLGRSWQRERESAQGLARRLVEREQELARIVAGIRDVLWSVRLPGQEFAFISDFVAEAFGYPAEAFYRDKELGFAMIAATDREAVLASWRDFIAGGSAQWEMQYRIRRPDGSLRWLHNRASLVCGPDGLPQSVGGVARDVTELREAGEALRLFNRALGSCANGVMLVDMRGASPVLIYVNPAFERMTGYRAEDVLGREAHYPFGGGDDGGAAALVEALRARREACVVMRNHRRDGSPYWCEQAIAPVQDEAQAVSHCVVVLNDISERVNYEEQLEYQATHDELTGLPNRSLYQDRCAQAIGAARRNHSLVALLLLDLDRFKLVNDGLGHSVGDAMLKAVAERLLGHVREGDTVARLGGDEFVVLLQELAPGSGEMEIAQFARRFLAAVAEPFFVAGQEIRGSASLGIALFPRDGDGGEALLQHADAAMYRAKEQGGGTSCFFTESMNARVVQRLSMEVRLRQALAREALCLHYQPKVALGSGAVVGSEALLRWSDEGTLVSPAEFIPVAEDSGLIEGIGEWVIESVCRQQAEWREAGVPVLPVAVNLSARQLAQPELAGACRRAAERAGLDPGLLDFELTESAMMADPELGLRIMDRLKDAGFGLYLDDFGTGYSSLSYLRRFPLDSLKIDRSFVTSVTTEPDEAAIATTIIAMAHSLRLKVVAEGVETEAQACFLRRLGCDEIQGYYFSRPVPADEFAGLLHSRRGLVLPDEGAQSTATLLLVDDEEFVRHSLVRALRKDGYRILSAASALEGLELLALHEVQIVISDQRMPNMCGTEFLSRVKELYPDTVRMVLSGYSELKSVTEAINRGAIYRYIDKPWDDGELREHVRDALRAHARKRSLPRRQGPT